MVALTPRQAIRPPNNLMAKGAKKKSKKQVGYLLSKGSPLSDTQKSKLKGELHSGKVKVKGGKNTRSKSGRRTLD